MCVKVAYAIFKCAEKISAPAAQPVGGSTLQSRCPPPNFCGGNRELGEQDPRKRPPSALHRDDSRSCPDRPSARAPPLDVQVVECHRRQRKDVFFARLVLRLPGLLSPTCQARVMNPRAPSFNFNPAAGSFTPGQGQQEQLPGQQVPGYGQMPPNYGQMPQGYPGYGQHAR